MRVRSWLSPIVVLVVALGIRIIDPALVEAMRLATFDEYQRLQPAAWVDAGVRIVDIDDESLERVGQWPWSRNRMARFLARLGEMGAAVVAFDIVFSEPDRTSPARVVGEWESEGVDGDIAALARRLPDHDEVFAAALREVPSVVGFPLLDEPQPRLPLLKSSWAFGGDDPKQFLQPRPGARPNLPVIEQAAAGEGAFASDPDRDGIYRRAPLLLLVSPPGVAATLYPALSLEALRVAQGEKTYRVRSSNASATYAYGQKSGINAIRVGQLTVPTDAKARLWLRDTGPVPERVVPAWRILDGSAPANAVEGMLVYVGASAPGLRDMRPTPLNPLSPGVEIHARATEQMLLQQFLERPDWTLAAELLWLIVLSAALVIALPLVGPIACAVIGGIGVFISAVGSWIAFSQLNLLLDPIFPAFASLALYLVASFEAFVRTEGERRRVRSAFSHYLSPTMVARLAADPAALRLGGEAREMTIMFTDIRRFTSRSEWMDAAALARFLNRFLTPMTAIIQEHRGTLDKYIGDAIMAFWNAPIDDPDHAQHSAEAALAMIAGLERLNIMLGEEAHAAGGEFTPIAIGIGLNSGVVSVGNMGSDQVFGYTVIGDDVNLASRLQDRTKVYGVPIVIGEKTAQRLPPDAFAVLELDRIRVRGKDRPVTINALLGDAVLATSPSFRTLAAEHGAMVAAYRARDWDGATMALARAREAAAGRLRTCHALYAARIAAMRASPPPADWDGVEPAHEE